MLQPSCFHVVHSVLLACCYIRRQHRLFYTGAMPLLAAMLETNRALSQAVYPVLSHMIHETPAKSIQAEAE